MVRFVMVFIGLLTLLSCRNTGVEPPEPTVADYINSAWNFYKSGNYVKAEADFRTITTSVPVEEVEVNIGIGWATLRQAKYNDAIAAFTYARSKGSNASQEIYISIGLAIIFNLTADSDAIVEQLIDKIEGTDAWIHKYDTMIKAVDIHTLLAAAYIQLKTIGDESTSPINSLNAWGQIKKALALDPNDVTALDLRSLLRGGAYEKSITISRATW